MTQTRKIVYGAPVQTSDLPTVISNIMAPGLLEGNTFSVAGSDLLNIAPGSCLLPDGVMILEDATRQLIVANTSFAASYTVAYQLQSTSVLGGSPAILTLLPGISPQSSFTDAVVIGWIQYPGGSAPLDPSQFIQPNSVQVNPPSGTTSIQFFPPFPTAISPAGEAPGSVSVKTVRFANLNTTNTQLMSFGGIAARELNATVTTDSVSIPASLTDYAVYTLKKQFVIYGNIATGTNIINNVSDTSLVAAGQLLSGNGIPPGTTVTQYTSTTITMSALATAPATSTPVTVGEIIASYSTNTNKQGAIQAGVPALLVDTASLPPVKFFIAPSQTLRLDTAITGNPPAASGELSVTVELPARSGNWQESVVKLGTDYTYQILNISNSTLTYNFSLPFMITGEGQPNKLVTRLNVDFNCIVTISLNVAGTSVTLSPLSGTVANTGGIVTQEFTVPTLSSVNYVTGTTALINVSIQAQAGGSASFAYIALSLDNAPYLIFV